MYKIYDSFTSLILCLKIKYLKLFMLKITHISTRCEFDCTDTPKMKLMNKKTVGEICLYSFYYSSSPLNADVLLVPYLLHVNDM